MKLLAALLLAALMVGCVTSGDDNKAPESIPGASRYIDVTGGAILELNDANFVLSVYKFDEDFSLTRSIRLSGIVSEKTNSLSNIAIQLKITSAFRINGDGSLTKEPSVNFLGSPYGNFSSSESAPDSIFTVTADSTLKAVHFSSPDYPRLYLEN